MPRSYLRAFFLFLVIAGNAAGAARRSDAWTVIGPGGGGAQFFPTISPHDPNVVVVGCDMGGAYISKDGGRNWRMFNLRSSPRFFVFDPLDPKVMYAQTIGLWRSQDAGATWELVVPNPARVTGVLKAGDHAEEQFRTATGEGELVRSLAIDPADSHKLFAVIQVNGERTLQSSPDWGKTWKHLADLRIEAAGRLYVDPKSPAQNRTLYVIGANRVTRFSGGSLHAGPEAPDVRAFVDATAGFRNEGGPPTVYGVADSGLYITRDGGETWTHSQPAERLRAVAASLDNPAIAYASYGLLREEGARYFGVLKTTDFGAAWSPVWKENQSKSPRVDDGWVSATFGPHWGEHPLTLGAAPKHPEIVYAGDLGRTLRSTDGGATWQAAYTKRAEDAWTTTGLDVTTSYGIHFDPFDRQRAFISYTDIGLFVTEDGGASWKSAGNGVPRAWRNTTYWVAFDPQVKGRMWAVMSGTHDLPRPKMWRRSSPENYRGGVMRSEDGGRMWTALINGIPQTAATHILVDPRSSADARILYVAGFGKGVFKSVDGGASWQARNNGLPGKEPFAWRLAQDPAGILYLVIARRGEDSSIGTEQDGAIYRSRNGAESWERVALPDNVNGPSAVTIDPQDSNRLYLSAWARRVGLDSPGGGVYLSTDGGANWRRVLEKDGHIYDVTVDAGNRSTLYACGFESSVWRSTDRGEMWHRLRGYNFKWGHRVMPDPNHPSMIYVTTFGGSVWHGPAAGDPLAVEDIITPQVSYHR